MAEIDGEEGMAGHHRRRVRLDAEAADGEAHRIGRIVMEDLLERADHGDGGGERVLAARPRGRPGMGVLAFDLDEKAPGALDAGDDADRVAFRLELGSLLDMRLEEGG